MSMSRYLVRRIEQTPNLALRLRTEIVELEGNGHLERVHWVGRSTEQTEARDIRHVVTMTGAVPNAQWLSGRLACDDTGSIKTGPGVTAGELAAALWPLARAPYHLETSLPGVFAVGDVRVMERDEAGFWESLGYHNYGDPWREQRYAGDR